MEGDTRVSDAGRLNYSWSASYMPGQWSSNRAPV